MCPNKDLQIQSSPILALSLYQTLSGVKNSSYLFAELLASDSSDSANMCSNFNEKKLFDHVREE